VKNHLFTILKNETMQKNYLQTMIPSARYIGKHGLALIFAVGLFTTSVNAQNSRNDEGRPQVRANTQSQHPQSRTMQTRTVQQQQPRTVQHQQAKQAPAAHERRTVTTRTRTTTQPATVARATNKTAVRRTNTIYRKPVYDAHNPGWRYANVPRRNTVVTVVPSGYKTVNYGGYAYRYNRGVFYRPYNNSFMVVAPPIGIFIDVMPIGYRRILVNDAPYYYYNGSYYQYRDSRYYVVSPPVGAIVESLPPGYQTLTIDGETYYTIDGAQYKPVVADNGEIWYQVIKAN